MGHPVTRPEALSPEALRRRCDFAGDPFASTEDLADGQGSLAQERAIGSIRFGIGMRADGYNVFAMGPEGVGRHTTVTELLAAQAAGEPVPPDQCYVYNFAIPHRPNCLTLPPGRARKFRQDMEHFVEDLRAGIPAAFETDQYRARNQEIETEFNERQNSAIGAVGDKAREQGIALLRTPSGFGFAPMSKDAVMAPQEFQTLPKDEQKKIETAIEALQEELGAVIQEMPKWRREAQRKSRELNREVTRSAVDSLIADLKAAWQSLPEVAEYLVQVQNDVLDHADFFRQPREPGEAPTLFGMTLPRPEPGDSPLVRYQVNLLVEHDGNGGAPVVYEDHPNHGNLVGRIEHLAKMGTLVTDFTLIKPGAMHRANGGYLVLDALSVLSQPYAWDALKRALRSRQLTLESPGQAYSLISTVSLEPEPIPLDLKIVLVGERRLYYMLHAWDEDFRRLFKVVADFDDDTERSGEAELSHARAIAALLRREKLRPLERAAVARVIEHAARGAGDAERLSVSLGGIMDLLREADYWAGAAGRAITGEADVRRAIAQRERAADRVSERLKAEVLRGTLLIDTSGERVGQINGLAVTELGGVAFGMPHRITARVRLGSGHVVDIERETEMGGPIHSKGVLILSGFLAGRYVTRKPLAFAASLVFEQSYAGVEGDSASSAELYALVSALSGLPLSQSLAVTGSVNQHGDVQAIGGVNEKIEGFFALCRERGLTGKQGAVGSTHGVLGSTQGVLIPASNVKHLMLRDEVVEAVAAGQFHIYPIETIDQGIELLTGVPAGERGPDDRYPPGSVNASVEERLLDYAERAMLAGRTAPREPRGRGARSR